MFRRLLKGRKRESETWSYLQMITQKEETASTKDLGLKSAWLFMEMSELSERSEPGYKVREETDFQGRSQQTRKLLAKYCPTHFLCSKILLGHIHTHSFIHIFYGCSQSTTADLGSCPQSGKHLHTDILQKKFSGIRFMYGF